MRFLLLGPPEVEVRGAHPDLGTPKQRAVLVRLLLEAPRAVSVDRIVEDLWAGEPPARATASLQAYVSNLRRILEPDRDPRAPAAVLVSRPPGYAVVVSDGTLDVEVATGARSAAASLLHAEPARALDAADTALRLWRGPALEGMRTEAFQADAARLDRLRVDLEALRLDALLALGRDEEAVVAAEALVERDPLRERSWESLVVALYRTGRAAAALDACRRCARVLAEELGLEPGPRLRQLEAAALRHDPAAFGRPTAPQAIARPRRARAGASSLVGRAHLLSRVGDALAAARSEGPRWVVLRGEAGIGKTTLLTELVDRARADGWRTAGAVAHEDPDVPAYWLWSQVLKGLPGEAGTLAGATASAREAGGDAARFGVYEGVRDALVRAAADAPVLVTLDDLQWADGDSLRLARFLSTQLRSAPVAVLATVRDGEDRDGSTLPETLAALSRTPGARSFPVPPLDPEELRRIAAQAADGRVAPDVLDRVIARAGGNPFFAGELARLAAAEPQSADGGGAALPLAVHEVVGRRLRRLPDAVRASLALGAVLGAAFDVAVLAAVEGVDVGALLERIDPAIAGGVLQEESTPLRLRFTHALLREALLADLGAPRRRRAHARIAAALRRRGGGAQDVELAHHLVEAGAMGDLPGARAAATAVGLERAGSLAFDEAARWFGRALDVEQQERALGEGVPGARFELLLLRADALFHSGQLLASRQVLLPAVEVATRTGDAAAVARAAAALSRTGGIWSWVDMGEVSPTLVGLLERGLERLGDAPSAATVRLLLALAMGQYYGPDPEKVDALTAQAVALARVIDEPGLLADALLDRAFAIRLPDRPAEVVALAEEALGLAGITDEQVVVAHARRFYGLLHLGELPAAIAAHARAAAAAERAHLMGPALQLGHFPAGVAAAEGRFADAGRLIAEAQARETASDQPALAVSRAGVRTLVAWLRGELAGMRDELGALAEAVPLRSARRVHALALVLEGDEDAARAAWAASRDGVPIPWLELVDACLEVELRTALEPPPDGAPGRDDIALLDLLRPRADMIAAAGTGYPWIPVGLALGMHEHRLGLLDDAERHLRAALARSEGWGTAAWSALCRVRLADVLEDVARRDPSEALAAEVRRLRAAARAVAARTGLALPERPGRGAGPARYNQLRRRKVM